MVIRELKPSKHVQGRWLAMMEDGSVLRVGENEVIQFSLYRGKELSEKLQGGLPAIALMDHAALSTAFANDVDGMLAYAQQVNGYGKPGDVFLGISTSGNAENVMYAAVTAKAKGMKVVGLTGKHGGKLAGIADAAVIVPEMETYKIQELHLQRIK